MTQDYWSQRVSELLPIERQARYLELARKASQMIILTKDELAELIALRDSLERNGRKE
jgi:hypothetical protein